MGVYRLSRKAADDLDGIYAYTIERYGLALAKKYLNGLHTCFEHLAEPRCSADGPTESPPG